MTHWPTRPLGRSGVAVTTIGLGTATLGGARVPLTDAERRAIVHAAWDGGLRYVDTAPFYGVGAAERAVGDALRDAPRDSWVLSTKVGRLLRPNPTGTPDPDGRLTPLPFSVAYDYGHDAILRSVEDSLQRLGLARIDILYVHDIGAYQHGDAAPAHMRRLRESGYSALARLKSEGTVRAIGIGVNETAVLMEALSWGEWDAFLLAGRYTLLEQAPLDDLLPLCLARGTSIVVGGPLNSGLLAGRDSWNYAPAPEPMKVRAAALGAVCARHGVALPAAALQFPLAHPAVAAVIPGPRSAAEAVENLALMRQPIPADLWAELKAEGLLDPRAPTP